MKATTIHFKQEDVVNYQGRDMAVVRAKLEKFPLILSTATPDLETVCNVEEGQIRLRKINQPLCRRGYAGN